METGLCTLRPCFLSHVSVEEHLKKKKERQTDRQTERQEERKKERKKERKIRAQ